MRLLWIYPIVVWSSQLIVTHAPRHDQVPSAKYQVFHIDVLAGPSETDILLGPGPKIDPLSGEPMAPAIPVQPSRTVDAIEPTMSISLEPTSDSLYPVFQGETNLPNGSMLNFELRCPHRVNRECYGMLTTVTVVDGGFQTEQSYRQIQPNAYSVQITMFPSLQGPEIQKLVGMHGELMKGGLIRDQGSERIFQFDGTIQTGNGN
jgi:hypothetical protein